MENEEQNKFARMKVFRTASSATETVINANHFARLNDVCKSNLLFTSREEQTWISALNIFERKLFQTDPQKIELMIPWV